MLGISHLLISGTATSLLLGTASPTMIAVGAIAGLLPDIDISTSPASRVLPWISSFFAPTAETADSEALASLRASPSALYPATDSGYRIQMGTYGVIVKGDCKESSRLALKLAAMFEYGIFTRPQPSLDAQIIRFDLSALGKKDE